MGSSSSKQKAENNALATYAYRNESPALTPPGLSAKEQNPSRSRPSSPIQIASETIPKVNARSSQTTSSEESAQATVAYPDLRHTSDAQIVSSEASDMRRAERPGEAFKARKSTSPLAQRRSSSTPVVFIPNTVQSLAVSLRERSHRREADALEALQRQAEKDAGSSTLLDAILSGKPLTERMNRDWQSYINEVEVVGSVAQSTQNSKDAEFQEPSQASKRKREDEEADDESGIPKKPVKQPRVAEDETVHKAGKRRRRKNDHREQPQLTTEDRPVRLVVDVGDSLVVLKRRRHKGKRGLGKRKKAQLERRRLRQAQGEEQAGQREGA